MLLGPVIAALALASPPPAGAEASDAESIAYYRKGAKKGDAEAQFQLGAHYHEGRGVDQDDEEAARWWRKASSSAFCRRGQSRLLPRRPFPLS